MVYDGGGEGRVVYEGGHEDKVRISPAVDVVSERAADERDPMVLTSIRDAATSRFWALVAKGDTGVGPERREDGGLRLGTRDESMVRLWRGYAQSASSIVRALEVTLKVGVSPRVTSIDSRELVDCRLRRRSHTPYATMAMVRSTTPTKVSSEMALPSTVFLLGTDVVGVVGVAGG